jgi:hypothetical protein
MKNLLTMLARMVVKGESTPLDIRIAGSNILYLKMELIHRCCILRYGFGNKKIPVIIDIVARAKDDGLGPFVFIYPPDGVDPDQPACLGMPVADISLVTAP